MANLRQVFIDEVLLRHMPRPQVRLPGYGDVSYNREVLDTGKSYICRISVTLDTVKGNVEKYLSQCCAPGFWTLLDKLGNYCVNGKDLQKLKVQTSITEEKGKSIVSAWVELK